MKSLARSAVVWSVCAALLAAQWPAAAWAEAGARPPEPVPAEAMKMFLDLGVYKNDADPLKTYLFENGKLTPIGRTMYLSLRSRYNPAEEVEAMKPILDRLRDNGVYTPERQNAAARAMALFEEQYGQLKDARAGSVEDSFRQGALREALMTGASISTPPKGSAFAQVEVEDGFEFWDRDGLAYRMTKNRVTTYSRDLQKNQRLMNLNRPPQVAAIPETGRYNYEMLAYSYWRLRNQEQEYLKATRIDRMIAMAELLGRQFPTDMWFNEPGLQQDLERQAKSKSYNHKGTTYTIFDIVEAKFKQRDAYLKGASDAVAKYESDMNRFKSSNMITDGQIGTMSLNEQNALRWLSLTVLETQLFHVKNQRERVDPASPDSQALRKMIDESDLTEGQKIAYREQGNKMRDRLNELARILDITRQSLNKAEYAGSLDTVQAALAATQKELGELSVDYSIYLEAPSTAYLAKLQAGKAFGGYNPISYLSNGVSTALRGAYKLTPWGGEYADHMRAIEGAKGNPSMAQTYTDISALIARGRREDWLEARNRIMALNPAAAQYSMSGTASGDPSKLNDALRIGATLRANHEHINAVTETNKTLDAATSFVTWSISLALLAPVARASLNFVGKLGSAGQNIINNGAAMGGLRGAAVQAVGYGVRAVGEIAKHTAARLQSLEPDAGRVRAFAGPNPVAQYAVASGARAISVATRQATFTVLAGGISSGFTVGTHLFDMATKRIGGVNIGGWQAIEPGHSMFSEDWDGIGKAAAMGFKGGAWWANESLDFGLFKIPTAALGYVGLPSTVFSGTRLAGAMEVIGTRGVVGSASMGLRSAINGSAAVEAAAASGRVGLLESMGASKWYTGKPALAFGLSMADNVAKYALFSQAAGFLGQQYAWYVHTNPAAKTLPLAGALTDPQDDVERRIKRSHQIGHAWLESPAWMLIPTHAAHGARDAGPYMQTAEGMRQYDAAGRTKEYANAPEGTVLKLERVRPPLSQLLFERRVWGEPLTSEWTVTKQAKEAGQLKEVTRLAQEGGLVNPIELMAVRELGSGEKFRTLDVTEEVQKVSYEVATDALVAQTKNSLQALTIKPGNTVKGWGEITPEIQIEIAKALYRAEVNLGRKLPAELSTKVREVLKDHLQANLPIGEAGKALRSAVVDLPLEAPKLDAAQKEAVEMILDWEVAPSKGKPTYLELTLKLREIAEGKVRAGELTAKEGKALTALYDYIVTGDKRFNAFNKTEIVKSQADVIFDALAVKFAERPEMLRQLETYRKEIDRWAQGRKGQPADGPFMTETPGSPKLSSVIARLEAELKAKIEKSPELFGPSERAALEKALTSVKTSAWVVRDAKGGAIPGWRPKQFVRLMQAFLGEGSHVKFVRSTTEGLFEAIRGEYKGHDALLNSVGRIESDVAAWVKSREGAPPNETNMAPLIEQLQGRLKESVGELNLKEGSALSSLVDSIAALDRQGLHKGILNSGRKGNDVQLFVKAPTSLGKTLLAYEGLLPYLEAEAAASGRKVMFLTFNTKLQAQAEFDFLAFNKLGSEVKFETYEGLKTLIADGKTKGRTVAEDYLMLQDEMDAAGQQPALTIGMVSGRVSKLNGQTTAINESNAGLAWHMSRLNTIRVEAAEVQAQRIQSVTKGISDAHVERGRLSDIRTAAADVLEAVSQLKRAKGPVETALAERLLDNGMASMRRLVEGGGLPASEAEAANTILGSLTRMSEALAERPAANPERRAQLAEEMEISFASQRRLMDLTNTVDGLTRLPAEATKARMAIEAKMDNLLKEIEAADASSRPGSSRRASLLREQLEFAQIEKRMLERFDGLDSSARLFALDEQIAAIRNNQAPAQTLSVNLKLSRLMRESVQLEARGTPEALARKAAVDTRLSMLLKDAGAADAATVKSYRAETARSLGFEREIGETRSAIENAKRDGQPTAELEARLSELNAGRDVSKASLRALETELGGVKSSPKLEALTREAERLESKMTPERRATHQEYRQTLDRVHALSSEMGEADAGGRAALEAERATARGRLRSIELEASAKPAEGDLGGLLRRISLLSSESASLSRRIVAAEGAGESAGALKSELKTVNREEKALRRQAREEIMTRFDEAGAEIVALTKEGKAGWDAQVNRLLETRRALQEAYTGDESALYVAYREMKENTRPIGEDPRLTREPYKVPGGEGMEPGAVLKRADFLIERARLVEAKPKSGGAGPIEAKLTSARAELEALSAAKDSPEFFAVADRLRAAEQELLLADSYHAADALLKRIDGDSFVRFLPSLPKFLWQALTGKLPEKPSNSVGLTRYHAAKMLRALSQDPMMPAHQRDNLMWSYLGSLILPKGLSGRGSYVRQEIVNMVQGFHDSAAGVRVDNRTGRFNVVHNGQWFESMDNASRRWWELEYGTDLTLPYTHNSMSTIKDVTTNKKSYFISLSGTSGAKFEAHLRANKISVVGEGSAMPQNVLLEVVSTPKERLQRVVDSLGALEAATRDHVVLRETDQIPAAAKKDIEAYMAQRGMKLSDPQVLKISEVEGAAAREWLQGIRDTQKNTGLIVLSVSDTRALRKVEAELKRAGVQQDEIAKVFADTEYLRLNVPEAKVLTQMNIEGLNTGRVKVLILDTRVGGRGLDLNFKGERNSTAPGAFRGYSNFEMLVLGPEEMSGVHMIQAMGRIDTGRTLSRAPRKFSLLLDVETAGKEAVFRNMFETDPFFLELRKDPVYQAYVRAHGGRIDWNSSNAYLLARAADGSAEGLLLAQRAEKAVRENLGRRNLEVEENLLRSSSVLTDAPTTTGKNPALERIR